MFRLYTPKAERHTCKRIITFVEITLDKLDEITPSDKSMTTSEQEKFEYAKAGSLLEEKKWLVPKYQRPYTWEWSKSVKVFWDDLRHYIDSHITGEKITEDWFFGIVFFSEQSNYRSIEDGQQRITTLKCLQYASSLLLFEMNKALNSDFFKSELRQNQTEELIRVILMVKDLIEKVSNIESTFKIEKEFYSKATLGDVFEGENFTERASKWVEDKKVEWKKAKKREPFPQELVDSLIFDTNVSCPEKKAWSSGDLVGDYLKQKKYQTTSNAYKEWFDEWGRVRQNESVQTFLMHPKLDVLVLEKLEKFDSTDVDRVRASSWLKKYFKDEDTAITEAIDFLRTYSNKLTDKENKIESKSLIEPTFLDIKYESKKVLSLIPPSSDALKSIVQSDEDRRRLKLVIADLLIGEVNDELKVVPNDGMRAFVKRRNANLEDLTKPNAQSLMVRRISEAKYFLFQCLLQLIQSNYGDDSDENLITYSEGLIGLSENSKGYDMSKLRMSLEDFRIIEIPVKRSEAQTIFRNINSTGEKLTPHQLIKNIVLIFDKNNSVKCYDKLVEDLDVNRQNHWKFSKINIEETIIELVINMMIPDSRKKGFVYSFNFVENELKKRDKADSIDSKANSLNRWLVSFDRNVTTILSGVMQLEEHAHDEAWNTIKLLRLDKITFPWLVMIAKWSKPNNHQSYVDKVSIIYWWFFTCGKNSVDSFREEIVSIVKKVFEKPNPADGDVRDAIQELYDFIFNDARTKTLPFTQENLDSWLVPYTTDVQKKMESAGEKSEDETNHDSISGIADSIDDDTVDIESNSMDGIIFRSTESFYNDQGRWLLRYYERTLGSSQIQRARSLEHLHPQSKKEVSTDWKRNERLINSIGNLVLLSTMDNQKLGSGNLAKKLKKFNNPNLQPTQQAKNFFSTQEQSKYANQEYLAPSDVVERSGELSRALFEHFEECLRKV